MVWRRLEVPIVIACWYTINLQWMVKDKLLRDGDEEGHVGAMELFKDMWIEDGLYIWFIEIWHGDYGEYPPLFAGLMGAWWGVITQIFGTTPPSDILIRSGLLIWPLLTALATARIAFLLKWEWRLAGLATLLTPLTVGVGRHFMLEPMMTALSTMSIAAAFEWKERPTIPMAILTGCLLGLGALTKQTMIVVAPIVILSCFIRSSARWHLLWIALPCLLIISPWFIEQMEAQEQYITMSIEGKQDTGLWDHVGFYPVTIFYSLGLLVPMFGLFKNIIWKKLPIPVWSWLATLVLFILIPKQYPRLLLPWIPVIPLLWAAGAIRIQNRSLQYITLFFCTGIGFIGLQPQLDFQKSLQTGYEKWIFAKIDDGCPQVWIRNPSDNDGDLSTIIQHLDDTMKKTIAISGNPQIPCHIQTTHEWRYHLEPYLRRRDIDVNIVDVSDFADPVWQDAHIQIIWNGETIETPMQLIINH